MNKADWAMLAAFLVMLMFGLIGTLMARASWRKNHARSR